MQRILDRMTACQSTVPLLRAKFLRGGSSAIAAAYLPIRMTVEISAHDAGRGDDRMPKFSRNLEQSLHRALALANERHHEYATLEHLLLALVDDEDAAPVMRACNVDIEKLRRGLETYVQSRGSKPPGLVLRQLTEEERTARAHALAESKVNEVEERRLAEEAGRPEVVDAEALLQFFADEHLPEHLREHSKPFGDLARRLVETLPSNPERTMALRKLLEAKDCAVRAKLFK